MHGVLGGNNCKERKSNEDTVSKVEKVCGKAVL
jgi:hypothetical protein